MSLKTLLAVLLLVQQALSKSADASLPFLVFGDWGGQPKAPYTTPAERNVAGVMGERAAKIGSQFTLALGDNFYDTGVTNVNDPRFKETFEASMIYNCMGGPLWVSFKLTTMAICSSMPLGQLCTSW
jgi:tartrate-resistant acid phosphatase type 5